MKPTSRLPVHDRWIIGLLSFFVFMAFTVELYWIVNRPRLPALADEAFLANLFRIYAAGDREYFDLMTPLPMALEWFNVFVTQALNLWLIVAILRRRPYRHALQLGLSAYLTYSVVLYFLTAHFNGYANMGARNAWGMFIFVAPNLPWLLGYAAMAMHSAVVITRRFAQRAPGKPAAFQEFPEQTGHAVHAGTGVVPAKPLGFARRPEAAHTAMAAGGGDAGTSGSNHHGRH